ncbi:unnamed protein product [Sympodiomycopsis kandeliae]
MRSSPSLLTILCLLVTLHVSVASAQFFNFFNQGGHTGQPREQEPPSSGDASWFEARTEAATCQNHLCSKTLACVPSPHLCPCPYPQQKRCPFPDPITGKLQDGGGFCVQEDSCEDILLDRGSWWELQKLDSKLMKAIRSA